MPWCRLAFVRRGDRSALQSTQLALSEAHDLVLQEIDQANDFGKDAYVDLTLGGTVSGYVVALQIKGGRKYIRTTGCAIPCDRDHAEYWFNSSLPVIGIVQDPRDGQLYWQT